MRECFKKISCVACRKYLEKGLLMQKERYQGPSHRAKVCKSERQQVPMKRVKVSKSCVACSECRWRRGIKQSVASDISHFIHILNSIAFVNNLISYVCLQYCSQQRNLNLNCYKVSLKTLENMCDTMEWASCTLTLSS